MKKSLTVFILIASIVGCTAQKNSTPSGSALKADPSPTETDEDGLYDPPKTFWEVVLTRQGLASLGASVVAIGAVGFGTKEYIQWRNRVSQKKAEMVREEAQTDAAQTSSEQSAPEINSRWEPVPAKLIEAFDIGVTNLVIRALDDLDRQMKAKKKTLSDVRSADGLTIDLMIAYWPGAFLPAKSAILDAYYNMDKDAWKAEHVVPSPEGHGKKMKYGAGELLALYGDEELLSHWYSTGPGSSAKPVELSPRIWRLMALSPLADTQLIKLFKMMDTAERGVPLNERTKTLLRAHGIYGASALRGRSPKFFDELLESRIVSFNATDLILLLSSKLDDPTKTKLAKTMLDAARTIRGTETKRALIISDEELLKIPMKVAVDRTKYHGDAPLDDMGAFTVEATLFDHLQVLEAEQWLSRSVMDTVMKVVEDNKLRKYDRSTGVTAQSGLTFSQVIEGACTWLSLHSDVALMRAHLGVDTHQSGYGEQLRSKGVHEFKK